MQGAGYRQAVFNEEDIEDEESEEWLELAENVQNYGFKRLPAAVALPEAAPVPEPAAVTEADAVPAVPPVPEVAGGARWPGYPLEPVRVARIEEGTQFEDSE